MIRQLLTTAVFTLLAIVFIGVAAPRPVAADLFKDSCSGGGASSAVCKDKAGSGSNPISGNNGAIFKIVNILAVIAGFAAVVIMIVSGLKLITSGGDTQEVATARKSIVYAAIGLVVIILSRSIISLVLSKI